LKLCKNKNFRLIGEQAAAAQNDITAKKIVSGLFQNLQRTDRRLDCWRPVPSLLHESFGGFNSSLA